MVRRNPRWKVYNDTNENIDARNNNRNILRKVYGGCMSNRKLLDKTDGIMAAAEREKEERC